MSEEVIGALLWALIFYPVWSPRCRRIRKQQRTVSGNNKTSQAWEQDEPYPECFDEQPDLGMEDDI